VTPRSREDVLSREWKRPPTKTTPWPASQREFLAFLETSRETLVATPYTDYDTLPGLQRRGIVSLGGSVKFSGTPAMRYSWKYYCTQSGDYWIIGDEVISFGKSREEAALRALLVLWELTVRRQKHSSIPKKS